MELEVKKKTRQIRAGLKVESQSEFKCMPSAKLYIPSTPNIDLILWHTHWIVYAVKLITHDVIHDFHFTFQAYTLPHTLNGICVSLFKFYT